VFKHSLEKVAASKLSTKSQRGVSKVIERIARCAQDAVDEADLSMKQIAGIGIGASVGSALFGAPPHPIPSRSGSGQAAAMIHLGMASYTFRAFPLDEALAMTGRLGVKRIALKSVHLPLESSPERIRAVAAKVAAAGLELYAGGVIYMRSETEVRQAFEYAKTAGMRIIAGVPDHGLLEAAERCVREFDISLAIHNHGPTDKLYPTPESVLEKIGRFDRRMGLCLDIGHTQRAGIDPSLSAVRCAERLIDVHIKDVTAAGPEGGPVEIGRGVVDIPFFLRTLVKLGYAGTVSLEYEKDERDPLPGASESIGYVRGALAGQVDS
jgi:sugar phosphate isomerase/epimerase